MVCDVSEGCYLLSLLPSLTSFPFVAPCLTYSLQFCIFSLFRVSLSRFLFFSPFPFFVFLLLPLSPPVFLSCQDTHFRQASRAVYALLYASIHLGYFISPVKSSILPSQRIIHLGFGIDSRTNSFFLPEKLRRKVRVLRELLLREKKATERQIQSWIGKCNHLKQVFPAASLFTLRCRLLEPSLGVEPSPLPQDVLDEISFWSFVDSMTEPIPFRLQRHLTLSLATDASGSGWGAIVSLPSGQRELRDYWRSDLFDHDICIKEGLAVLFALEAIEDQLLRRIVTVFVDNEGLANAWAGLKSRSTVLTDLLKTLFLFCVDRHVSLKMVWVPTTQNPADAPSRVLRRCDSSLVPRLRSLLWQRYGPFSFDLMALPSNVLRDPSGAALPFFAPFPVPGASGVDVFAQTLPSGLLWVFPVFVIIIPIINLLREAGGVEAVLILPLFPNETPAWLHLLRPFIVDCCRLSSPSDRGVLELPSPKGYCPNLLPLKFGLSAYRCSFPPNSLAPAIAPRPSFRVHIFGDSLLRPLQSVSWPPPFVVIVHCFPGAKLYDVFMRLLRLSLSPSSFDALLFHAGANDVSRITVDFERHFDESVLHASRALRAVFPGKPVFCSTICQTADSDINQRVAVANSALRTCSETGVWSIISNDNVLFSDLSDTVHLNGSGVAKFFRNIVLALRSISP